MRYLILILGLSSLLFSCSGNEGETEYTVIKGATVYDGTGDAPIENSEIIIRNDKIDCIGSAGDCSIPMGSEVIDASGKFITPGMIDAHMHFFQTGFFDSRPDAMDLNETYPFPQVAAYQEKNPQRYYDTYLCSGVTGVYDVGGMSWSVGLQEEAEQNPKAPHVAAAGPLLTPVPGAPFDLPSDRVLVQLDSEETGVEMVQYMSALGSTGIKFWMLRADSEEYMNRVETAAREIEKHGNQMIAHATTLEQAKAAIRNGAKLLVHSVEDQEVDEEFIELAKEEGTIYNPTLIVGAGYMVAYRGAADIAPIPIDDPNGCVDQKTRELITTSSQFQDHPRITDGFKERLRDFDPETDMTSDLMLQNLKTLYEAGIPIVVGTDAGNPGTLHGISIFDEMEMMQKVGITPEDLIVMATKNGAMAMRRLDDFGTLERGKFGNLIMMDENPSEDISNMRSLTHVMIKGEMMEVGE
ncbi:amidohydrolase family protein [Gracilimonas sp.]|uniref:amidohydrolase family protein n=1 Tax=Gracilimonas sp. TaxID=1974203 RepID=UPI002870F181|nr:amidohydrolase family protein [Gracilimonas sp.]